MAPPSPSSGSSLNTSHRRGSMLVAPSTPTHPAHLSLTEHNLTIPDRPALAVRKHSTLSPLHTSRPLRSSPLAGPSIAPEQDGTLNLGPLSAPATPRGGAGRLLSLAEASDVAGPGTTQTHRRRRTLSAVLSKMSFPSSASSTSTSTSSASSTSTSSTSSVPDQPAGKPRRRLRSLGAEDAPPVPPMPVWAHNTMPNRGSQNLSPSSSSSMRSHVYPRRMSVSVPSSPLSSREHLPSTSARPRPRPTHGVRRSVIQGQEQGRIDARPTSTGRLPPSTSRNPEENWLTQAAPPTFSRMGLKAQGVVMPVSARDARRTSTMSTASATARAKSLELGLGGPPRPKPAHVAPNVSHGRVPRRPSTAPSLQLALMPALVPGPGAPSTSQSQLRSRPSSLASASSTRSHASDGYFGDRSGCDTPPLTMSSMTSASSVSVSFADPPVAVVGPGADEFGVAVAPSSPESGVQFRLNNVPVPPEANYDAKGKGKAGAVAVDVRSVGSVGSIGSMVSQTSWSAYSARTAASGNGNGNGNESLVRGEGLSFGTRHARPATAPASAASDENGKRRKSAIARMWKQVVRSVAHR